MDATPNPPRPSEPMDTAIDCDTPTCSFAVSLKGVSEVSLGDVVKVTVTGKVKSLDTGWREDGNARMEVELGSVDVSEAPNGEFADLTEEADV